MNKYPEYVSKNRPKGTVIKKVNDTYYVYECKSKRVKDKPYPIHIMGDCIGKIDYTGFHENEYIKVSKNDEVIIREYGFSNYLLTFLDEYLLDTTRTKKDRITIFKNIITYLSINSYLCDDDSFSHYTKEELIERYNIGFPNQVTSILKMTNKTIEELEDLKSISFTRIGKYTFYSKLTNKQIELLNNLGVTYDDIKGK